MQPNFSLIFFTTMAGMAQGLLVSIATIILCSATIPNPFLAWVALPTAIIMLLVGLMASLFHLGHPERAWRAIFMWRTSWLSREVIVLPLFIGSTGLALLFAIQDKTPVWLWVYLVICATVLWLCTAKIYQCIRFIQEWAHNGTFINFVALGITSGWLLLGALLTVSSMSTPTLDVLTISKIGFALLLASMIIKLWIWRFNRQLKPKSNLGTATGIKNPIIRQLSMGLMGGSFNTREFFHHQSNLMIANIRKIVITNTYLLPMVLLAIAIYSQTSICLPLACLIHCTGLIAERWLFFADANHPQNLYYQRVS